MDAGFQLLIYSFCHRLHHCATFALPILATAWDTSSISNRLLNRQWSTGCASRPPPLSSERHGTADKGWEGGALMVPEDREVGDACSLLGV